MTRSALLVLVLLAGCTTSSPPASHVPVASEADAMSATGGPVDLGPAPRRAPAARASDWAMTVVGTPFVFGFRAVVCAASAVVAAPAAAVFAVSDDPRGGFAYLRRGLAQNCGPPYAVPLPSATDRAREREFVRYVPERYDVGYAPAPPVGYAPGPGLGPPRPLTPYHGTAVMSP